MKTLKARMLCIFLCLVAPLLALLICVNAAGAHRINQQMQKIRQSALDAGAAQIGNTLRSATQYMSSFLLFNTDVDNMQYLADPSARVLATVRLKRNMTNSALQYPFMQGIFLYSIYSHEGLLITGGENEIQQSYARQLCQQLWQELDQGTSTLSVGKWQQLQYEDTDYLLYLYRADDAYMGFLTRISDLVSFSVSTDGTPLQICAAEDIPNGTYLQAQIPETDYFLLSPAPVYYGLWSISFRDSAILILPITIGITFLILFSFLRRQVLQPMQKIVHAMETAGSGDLSVRVDTDSMLQEFAVIGDTFNQMLVRITAMQENIRLQTKEKESAQLRNLQLQINPHFLSNCFNAVYNASMNGDTQTILQFTTYLSSYFRCMAQVEKELVTLEEELRFTNDFLTLQKLRFGQKFSYEIKAPLFLKQALLPPGTLKTFAENALQHGRDAFGAVELELCVTLCTESGRSCLQCVIRDNGPGFSSQILEQLSKNEALFFEGRTHLGINNIRQRLRLLYGDNSTVLLENAPEGGAVVTVRIPLCYKERGTSCTPC